MRRAVLTGLNFSQFCSMGLGYLKAFADHWDRTRAAYDISVLEFPSDVETNAVADAICIVEPLIAGFTVHHGLAPKISEISELVKKRCPGTIVVWGGTDVTGTAEAVLHAHPAVDIAVRGEGEQTFVALLEHFADEGANSPVRADLPASSPGSGRSLESIAGITFRKAGAVTFTADRPPEANVDIFPSPYLAGALDPRKYPIAHVETYRGCPFKCKFCFEHRGFERVRAFPVARVTDELGYLLASGVKAIKFFDTVFTYPKPRILKILEFLEKHGGGIYVSGETAAEFVDGDIARAMARAGVPKLEVGLQSSNTATLRRLGRSQNLEAFESCIRLLLERRITPIVHVMAALPGETYGDFRNSFNYVFAHGAVPMVFHTKVLPGTALAREASQIGIQTATEGMPEIRVSPELSAADFASLETFKRGLRVVAGVEFAIPVICRHLGLQPFELVEEAGRWVDDGHEASVSFNAPVAWLEQFLSERFQSVAGHSKIVSYASYCYWEWWMRQPVFPYQALPAFWKDYDLDVNGRDIWHPEDIDLRELGEAPCRVCYFRTSSGRYAKEALRAR